LLHLGEAQISAIKDLQQFVVESSVGYRHSWAKYPFFHRMPGCPSTLGWKNASMEPLA
jgi:hypothetical protein